MKKILFVLTSAALVFTACQKEENENAANNGEVMSLTAIVEQQVDGIDTKSSLSGTTVNWTEGDFIKVFDATGKYAQLEAQSDGTTVNFTETGDKELGFSETGTHYAIYPYSAGATCSDSTISFSLPAAQTYAANSFGQGANVAVASFSGSSAATFRNVCGVLKLQLKGTYKVSKIELSGNANEKLNGTYSVNASTYTMTCGTAGSDAEKVITLNCPDEGVQLSTAAATTFYFVVPAGAFHTSGFTAKVYDADGLYDIVATNNPNIINRSYVRAMSSRHVSLLHQKTANYEELTYAQFSGRQVVETNFQFSNDNNSIEAVLSNWAQTSVFMSANSSSPDYTGINVIWVSYLHFACWDGGNRYYGWNMYNNDEKLTFKYTSSIQEGRIKSSLSLSGDPNNIYLPLEFTRRTLDDPNGYGSVINGVNLRIGGELAVIAAGIGGGSFKLYSLKIYENSVLSLYLLPCKGIAGDDLGKVGFFDVLSSTYYDGQHHVSVPGLTEGDTLTD